MERDEALGVVGWVGEKAAGAAAGGSPAGRDLLFNGHIDVVPVGDEAAWTTPPWDPAVRDGRVYGRGAVDMKGGLCCALFAAKAVRDAGVRLRGRLSVASVVGEEDGGTGTLATILRGHSADGAVVVEPTRLHVVAAQAGSLMFRLVVHGLSAHGCVREEGVSAVEKFVPLLAALRRLEAERWRRRRAQPLFAGYRLPWPIEVGTVRAGDWASSVPDTLVAEGRYGVAVGEDVGRGPAGVRRGDRPRRRGRSLAGRAPAGRGVVGRTLRPGRDRRGPPDRDDGHRRGRRRRPARRLRSRASPTAPTCACSSTSGASRPSSSAPATSASRTCRTSTSRSRSSASAAEALVLTALRFCGVEE